MICNFNSMCRNNSKYYNMFQCFFFLGIKMPFSSKCFVCCPTQSNQIVQLYEIQYKQ